MIGRNLMRRLGGAFFAAAWLALLAPGLPARSEGARSLVVVTSRDDGPYEGVVEGIQETLGRLRGDLEVKVQSLQSGGPDAPGPL